MKISAFENFNIAHRVFAVKALDQSLNERNEQRTARVLHPPHMRRSQTLDASEFRNQFWLRLDLRLSLEENRTSYGRYFGTFEEIQYWISWTESINVRCKGECVEGFQPVMVSMTSFLAETRRNYDFGHVRKGSDTGDGL